MDNLKILIILPYFNRPKMVINALKSIKKANEFYENWELAFIDDSSKIAGEGVVKEQLPNLLNKINFYNSNSTTEEKIKHTITHVVVANKILKETDADIAIVLCDDDTLYPDYLLKLNDFFNNNPNINSCYSDMVIFNPLEENYDGLYEKYLDGTLFSKNLVTSAYVGTPYERRKGNHGPCCGAGRMDACQVAWRVSCNQKYEAWWPRVPRDHDFFFYEQLYHKTGAMIYSGTIGQFKGWHKKQFGKIFNQFKNIVEYKVDIDI